MSTLLLEFRQAFRALWRSPGFTIPLLLVLSLGLGTSVALHGILQRVLLRPLALPRAQELFEIRNLQFGPEGGSISFAQFEDLRQAFPSLAMGAATEKTVVMADLETRPTRIAEFPTSGYFAALGIRPHLGRLPRDTAEPEAMLSYALWTKGFGADPNILGRALRIQGQAFTVVGVAPRDFEGLSFGAPRDLWMPSACLDRFMADPEEAQQMRTARGFSLLTPIVRLDRAAAPGFPAALEACVARLAKAHPATDGDLRLILRPLAQARSRFMETFLPDRALVFGASALGLVLTAVGAAGLMAARMARRRRELLVRGALGGTRWELARPLLAEALILAALTLPLALCVGWILGEHLLALPQNVHVETARLHLDFGGSVLPVAAGLCLALLGASVALPLRQALRLDLSAALRQDSAQSGKTGGGSSLVAIQVALSLALLAASSVAIGALRSGAKVGYPLPGKAFLQVNTRLTGGPVDVGLPDRLLARAKALPGVQSAALGAAAPLDGMAIVFSLADEQGKAQRFEASFIGPDWFQSLDVPVLEGREFQEADGKRDVILSAALARKLFPGAPSVVGRILPQSNFRVVGVVADHRQRVDKELHQPMLFLTRGFWTSGQTTVLVRTDGNAQALPAALASILAQEAPGLPPMRALTLEDQLDRVMRQERQNLRLLGLLGLGSLALACFGLWAALNLHITLRRRELGIRAALGASLRRLVQSVMARGLRLLALGMGAGLALTWALVRLGHWRWPRMPEPSAFDVLLAALALLAAGLLACLVPALRAARVNPADALRSE